MVDWGIVMAIKKYKRLFIFPLLMGLVSSCGNNNEVNNTMKDDRNLNAIDYAFNNLCGEDALGRVVNKVNKIKSDKTRYVGLWYSVWLGGHKSQQRAVYDITKLEETEDGMLALKSTEPNTLSQVNEFHFWGEPLYGYYNSQDPFVITRHIELFINAGIDYLCLDATNDVLYPDATYQLLDLLMAYQLQGYNVPKIVFYTNSNSGSTVDKLWYKFYQNGKYQDVMFSPNGKPLIIGITKNNNKASDQTKYYPFTNFIADEYLERFDVKESEWPNGDHNENSIPWMSWEYPQRVHKETNSICIDVAQHSHSVIYVSSEDPECHRGYNNITKKLEGDYTSGLSFQQMWDTALKDVDNNINNVLVTSFNEWMAIKQPNATFVDVYDKIYSRDIEMMKGGYNDNYYMQLVKNVREFKYDPFIKYDKEEHSIDISKGVAKEWKNIKTHYQDLEGDALNRNFKGAVDGLTYKSNSKRNDIKLVKVTHDKNNIYFYIECSENLTKYDGSAENFMNILLKTKDSDKNFMGCNVLINRKINGHKGSVEISNGGYDFTSVDEADVYIDGNVMQVKIPRRNIETNETCDIEFKVCDNVTDYKDVMDYYVTGDVMPLGRLRYGY